MPVTYDMKQIRKNVNSFLKNFITMGSKKAKKCFACCSVACKLINIRINKQKNQLEMNTKFSVYYK